MSSLVLAALAEGPPSASPWLAWLALALVRVGRPSPVLRTLVVDDDPGLRTLVRLTLGDDGRFEVVGDAANGKEAIELAQRLQPDLILLDLRMPVMDGFAALPHIRDVAPRTKVVALSMLQASEAEGRVLALGAMAFLDKGLKGEALVDRLAKLVLPRQ